MKVVGFFTYFVWSWTSIISDFKALFICSVCMALRFAFGATPVSLLMARMSGNCVTHQHSQLLLTLYLVQVNTVRQLANSYILPKVKIRVHLELLQKAAILVLTSCNKEICQPQRIIDTDDLINNFLPPEYLVVLNACPLVLLPVIFFGGWVGWGGGGGTFPQKKPTIQV